MYIIINQLYLNPLVKIKCIGSLAVSELAQIFALQYVAYSACMNGCSWLALG